MFDFTLMQVLRDLITIVLCFGVIGVAAVCILYIRWYVAGRGDKAIDGCPASSPGKKRPTLAYFQNESRRPIVRYGVLTLGLFFSVYACRLVVIKMVLALCYAFVIARVFLRSDPR